MTLLRALDAPDASPAFIYVSADGSSQRISRADFHTGAGAWAARLAELPPGAVIILAGLPIPQTMLAFWGALWRGVVPAILPPLTEKLDPAIYWERLGALIDHSGARAVLTGADFAPDLRARSPVPVLVPDDTPPGAPPPIHTPAPDDIAFLQHSSGTTGLQKGVALAH
ncbi:MAG: AMP-binding protein, partial [Anaerolineales bacterium]